MHNDQFSVIYHYMAIWWSLCALNNKMAVTIGNFIRFKMLVMKIEKVGEIK